MKEMILTGLRINNDLTLGNYLGAVLPMVNLQKKYSSEKHINMFIPDLHSFTTPVEHDALYAQTISAVKIFLATGLDADDPNTHIYRQSKISGHSELAIILANFTYMGELSRQTQFKDKSSKGKNVSVGLYFYPVLMAADILLYGARYVPVGADQAPHVELARDIAIRFNNKFGDVLKLPEAEKEQIQFTEQQERSKIKDLQDPSKKMSKSDQSGKGVIYLNDTPAEAKKKVMSATTDSVGVIHFDPGNQPGVSNLLTILAALRGVDISKVTAEFEGNTNYGEFKEVVGNEVANFLENLQQNVSKISDSTVEKILEDSEEKASKIAVETLTKVQKAVGLS